MATSAPKWPQVATNAHGFQNREGHAMGSRYHVSLPRGVDKDVQEYARRNPHLLKQGDAIRSLIALGLRSVNCLNTAAAGEEKRK